MSVRKKGKEHKKRQLAFLSRPLNEDSDGDDLPASSKKSLNLASKRQKKALLPSKVPSEMRGEGGEEESADDEDYRQEIVAKNEARPEDTFALPVRTEAGSWKLVKSKGKAPKPSKDEQQDGTNSDILEDDNNDIEDEEDQEPEPSVSEKEGQRSFDEVKLDLAAIAMEVTEDSDENVSKIKDILAYCDRKHEIPIRRLALVTALAVFKDILPGYYIRPLSDGERTAKVSKDVKKTRVFEESILLNYKRFFEVLKSILQPLHRRFTQKQLPVVHVAITCLCEVMTFASHFNLFEDMLKLAMTAFATLPWEAELQRICDAFKDMYAVDETGKATMLAVRLISNMIKDREYDCPVIWLHSLETVKLRADVPIRKSNDAVLQPKKKHLTGKQKREYKAKQEEMRKLAEAESTFTREERQKWNSETIKHLFRIYFGILKHATSMDLLPPILAGIAKHTSRISVEYFADLLNSLRRLIDNPSTLVQDQLDIVATLHCIQTVDRIYAINENLAAMDLKFFYNCLYRQLGRLYTFTAASADDKAKWNAIQSALAKCLGALFHPKRHLPQIRVAAFAQRLGDLALSLQANGNYGGCLFILEQMREIFTHQVKSRSVLDPEPFGQGAYNAACVDPDLCNPHSRSLQPILISLKHNNNATAGALAPKIRSIVDALLKISPN